MDINTSVGEIENAYGIYFTVDDVIGFIEDARRRGAKHTVDIAVKYQDRVIEFDLVDFLTRLGFMDENEN